MIEYCKKEAEATFEENLWRFEKNEILLHADRADVPKDFRGEIEEYLDFVHSRRDIASYMWQYYYALYMSKTDIFPIIRAESIPPASISEQKYPGMFMTVLSLAAARHFEKYIEDNDLTDESLGLLNTYYKNIRRFMEMNKVRDNTYALIRHGYFLYGYAKPFSLRIGRLAYELREYESDGFDFFLSDGKTVAAATGGRTDADGFPDRDGTEHEFSYDNGALTACVFGANGKLEQTARTFDASPILKEGEPFITVHIPGEGRLTAEAVEDSLKKAAPILQKAFKKYAPKQIMCTSWLLSPQLREFLPSSSNILRFASYFDTIGWYKDEQAIYEHIFRVPVCPISQLKASNSFQQGILDIYKSGRTLHCGRGILKKEFNYLNNNNKDVDMQ